MLRLIFVFLIVVFGACASLFSPFYALLFYLWNAYFRPDDWTYGGLVASLNLSFIIGAYLVLATTVSMPRVRVNLRVLLLALFFVQTVLSTWNSEYYYWSLSAWVDFSKVLIVCYIIILLASSDRQRFRSVFLVMAISLGFEMAKQGWAQLYVAPGSQNNNPIVFLGDNNGVAVGAMMLVPILSALAQTSSRKWEAFMHRFLLIGVFMRGITTYSRGGFLSAAVVGLFTLARSRKKIRALIGGAVIVAIVLSVMPQQFWDRMNTINASEEDRDTSELGRLHFWFIARLMAEAKPLSGVGFNAYSQSYETYNGPSDYGEFSGVRSVHSIWFGVLAELGYPGLVLFVGLFASSLWSCWYVSFKCRRDPEKRDLRIYANALMASLAAYGVGGTFLPLQYNEMAWHFMALTMTLSFLVEDETLEATVRVPVTRPLQPALAGVLRQTLPQ